MGKRILAAAGVLALIWLGGKYLLPILLPFLLGAGLAGLAEPLVRPLSKKLPRWAASFVGVSAALIALLALITLLLSLLVRELSILAQAMPDLESAASEGLGKIRVFLLNLTAKTPAGIRPLLTRSVGKLTGTEALGKVFGTVSTALSGFLMGIPDGAFAIATGVLAAYLISSRLPKITVFFRTRLPNAVYARYLPALRRVKKAIFGWLKAQATLSLISCCILTVGMLLLRIPYAPLLGALIALVDALPLLGTGTVLLPWALVCLLQDNSLLAIGLLGLYVATALTRSTLEPRLVGKQLGIDPLTTLVALYVGYRLFGLPGMLLSPIFTVTALELVKQTK